MAETSDNLAYMRTVFIRHNFDHVGKKIIGKLMKRELIGIRFEDIPSTEPEDYKEPGAKRAMARLIDYCKTGAIVGADFTYVDGDSMLVGKIKPDTKVKPEKFGRWFFKTAQLHEVKQISLRKYAMLSATKPRQQTLTGWPSAGDHLARILKDEKYPLEVSSLDPSQLEVICYEYLRKEGILGALLMPIGRTIQDVDILGIDGKGKRVIAQVTHSKNVHEIKEKMEKLKKWGSHGELLFFFGPKAEWVEDNKINYKPNEEVFELLLSNKHSIQYKMICDMLDINQKP